MTSITEALELTQMYNKVEILWQERELVTAVLYQDYCKRNNLPLPKNIEKLLETAYNNMMIEQQQIQEENIQTEMIDKQQIQKKQLNTKDFR